MSRAQVLSLPTRCDAFGITASGVCLLHCILSPLVFVFFPAAEAYMPGDDVTHHVFGVIVLVTGCIAFFRGYQMHRQRVVAAVFIVGIGAVGSGSFAHHWIAQEQLAGSLVIVGSVLLLAAHFLNRTFCDMCSSCQH
jgi:drug/metabolite transporter (DMT)-like permease